jgi:hypothetical protein
MRPAPALPPTGVEQYGETLGNTHILESAGPESGPSDAGNGPNGANSPAELSPDDTVTQPTQPTQLATVSDEGSTLAEAILAVQRLPLPDARKAEIIDQLCTEAETVEMF